MNMNEYLLDRLKEEALEIAHATSKASAFGLYGRDPRNNQPNIRLIGREYAEMMAIMDMLKVQGVDIMPNDLEHLMLDKKMSVVEHMQYARNRGTLLDDLNGFYDHWVDVRDSRIFVFGSNLAGNHGKGAAETAVQQYGAIMGQGEGLQGHAYAIPTKDARLRPLPLDRIIPYIQKFVEFTHLYPMHYYVTPVGCGYANYVPMQIAPHFKGAIRSLFPLPWKQYIEEHV